MATKPKDVISDPQTASHIPVHEIYTPSDLESWDYDRQVGYPGQYPFTRGVQSDNVPRPVVDDAPIRRFRGRGGIESALQVFTGERDHRIVGGV